MHDKIELMHIEVTYSDDSQPSKRPRLKPHLPKPRLPKLHTAKIPKFKFHIPKAVRNVLLSAGILLVLLVGGGVAYTMYMDGNASKDLAANAQTVAAPSYSDIKPAAISPNASEGVAVEMVSSPVSVGSTASIDIHTNPTSKCTISVVYNKVVSTDPGLTPKIADNYGSVNWTWTVGSSTPIGKWPVTVRCVFNGRDGVVQADLEVTK